jgi:hypothetical protein
VWVDQTEKSQNSLPLDKGIATSKKPKGNTKKKYQNVKKSNTEANFFS